MNDSDEGIDPPLALCFLLLARLERSPLERVRTALAPEVVSKDAVRRAPRVPAASAQPTRQPLIERPPLPLGLLVLHPLQKPVFLDPSIFSPRSDPFVRLREGGEGVPTDVEVVLEGRGDAREGVDGEEGGGVAEGFGGQGRGGRAVGKGEVVDMRDLAAAELCAWAVSEMFCELRGARRTLDGGDEALCAREEDILEDRLAPFLRELLTLCARPKSMSAPDSHGLRSLDAPQRASSRSFSFPQGT